MPLPLRPLPLPPLPPLPPADGHGFVFFIRLPHQSRLCRQYPIVIKNMQTMMINITHINISFCADFLPNDRETSQDSFW